MQTQILTRTLSSSASTINVGGRFDALPEATEAERMAMRTGNGIARLWPSWNALLSFLPRLGHVRAVTRNWVVSMETSGIYAQGEAARAQRPCAPIRFEVNLPFWRSAFVEVERRQPERAIARSIHFYGKDGSLIHTVRLTRSSSIAAFEEIVESFVRSDRPMEPLVDETVSAHPAVSAGENGAFPVSRTSLFEIVHGLARNEVPVTVSVVNNGCTHTHCGWFRRIRNAQGLLHVKDCGTEIQFSEESIAQAWVVKVLATDGYTEALKLFDTQGREAAFIVPARRAEPRVTRRWSEILMHFASQVAA